MGRREGRCLLTKINYKGEDPQAFLDYNQATGGRQVGEALSRLWMWKGGPFCEWEGVNALKGSAGGGAATELAQEQDFHWGEQSEGSRKRPKPRSKRVRLKAAGEKKMTYPLGPPGEEQRERHPTGRMGERGWEEN